MSVDLSSYFAPRHERQDLAAQSFSDTALEMKASKILTISYSVRERIAAGIGFTVDFTTERNTPRISEGEKSTVDSRTK